MPRLAQAQRLNYTIIVRRDGFPPLPDYQSDRLWYANRKGHVMTDEENLMSAGKARWLLEGGLEKLSDEERALLLAMVSLDADTGRTLTDEEKQALDALVARAGGDGAEISRAIKHMVQAKPKKRSDLDWSDLKKRLRRK